MPFRSPLAGAGGPLHALTLENPHEQSLYLHAWQGDFQPRLLNLTFVQDLPPLRGDGRMPAHRRHELLLMPGTGDRLNPNR